MPLFRAGFVDKAVDLGGIRSWRLPRIWAAVSAPLGEGGQIYIRRKSQDCEAANTGEKSCTKPSYDTFPRRFRVVTH